MINPFIARMCVGVDKEYKVTVRDNICNGVYQDVNIVVHNAAEFATACKERFKKRTVSLISQAKCSDELRDYAARAKDVDKITCVDLAWLAKKDDTAFRYAD